MLTTTAVKSIAAGLVMAGVAAGAVGAQVLLLDQGVQYLNCGPGTVGPNEHLRFHVSLDDNRPAEATRVRQLIFDPQGNVVARKDVALPAGHTSTLQLVPGAAGPYRAHADVLDTTFSLTDRRSYSATVEAIDQLTGAIRTVCSVDQGGLPQDRN